MKLKITKKLEEPRYEVSYLKNKKFGIYLHPNDAYGEFSEAQAKGFGFTKSQLDYVKKSKDMIYFVKVK